MFLDDPNLEISDASSCKILNSLDKISFPSLRVNFESIGLKTGGCVSFF